MSLFHRVSYSRKLFIWLLGYSVLLVGCFVCFQYHREKKFKADELNVQLQLINAHILDDLDRGGDAARLPSARLHPFDELRVSVIDSSGMVVYDNTLDTLPPGTSHLTRREIAEAFRTGSGYSVRRHSESTGQTYFYSATLGRRGYVVRTAVPYSVSLTELLRADFGFLWIMGGVTLLMCMVGYFATRRLGLHILRLNRFAESAERGDRIYDTAPFPRDELGEISNHIVRLYASLQQAIADRDREHRAALHEQREKERIKKQLTNNINHELKTPVASIQVCLETLMAHRDIDEGRREDFLKRCLANADRLRRLLADVSLVTRMDDAPATIRKEPVDLADVIAEVVDDCGPAADMKGIEIDNTVTGPLTVNGNATLLSSVFRNLIDNAIAYSGGSRVAIRLQSTADGKAGDMRGDIRANGGTIVLTVADDGCGVPPEHLPHLFERFYRIDKGRSRAAGGTGLGLAIVKNVILLHGGSVTVANLPASGLSFTITFPV